MRNRTRAYHKIGKPSMNLLGGFTVIELMLAMAFISLLLMTIVMTAIYAGGIYNRGLSLKSVNQVGRDTSDIIRRDFTQTDQRTVERTGGIVKELFDGGTTPVSGRFCLGNYTYLWNYPVILDQEFSTSSSAVRDPDGDLINFVRMVDPDASLCRTHPLPVNLVDPAGDKLTHILKSKADGSEVVLAVHKMLISEVASVPDRSDGLFDIEFTLGTSKISEIDSMSCRPPKDDESNLEFCAINQFNMIVRTNG